LSGRPAEPGYPPTQPLNYIHSVRVIKKPRLLAVAKGYYFETADGCPTHYTLDFIAPGIQQGVQIADIVVILVMYSRNTRLK
jgi:hypothetical protein